MRHHRRHRRHLIEALEPRQFLSTVTVANATASESDGTLTFHVSLDAPADHDVTLNYVTTPDAPRSATPNKDFLPTRGKLTLPAGQTSADITVPLKNDSLFEPTETLRLSLRLLPFSGGPQGRAPSPDHLSTPSAKGTITDDDTAPTITFTDVTTKESNTGQHAVTLTVSLSKPAGSPLTFQYTTTDDTPHYLAATAGSDYTHTTGTLTFLPGQTQKTLRVLVKGDTTPETNESFRVTLTYQGIEAATAAVTIQDDDKPAKTDAPTLTFADATITESDSNPALTVTLSRPATQPVTVQYTAAIHNSLGLTFAPFLGGGAAGDNFAPSHGTLTIPAGQTSATIPLSITNDSLREPDCTVDVTLFAAKGATLPNGRPSAAARVTITDDDPLPSQTFALAPSVATIYAPYTYTAVGTLTPGSIYTATLPYNPDPITLSVTSYDPGTITGGTAVTGSGSLTLTNGATFVVGTPINVATGMVSSITITGGAVAAASNGTLTLTDPPPSSGSGNALVFTPDTLPPSFVSSGLLVLSPGTTTYLFPPDASPDASLDAVRARLLTAYNAGTWTGPGLPASVTAPAANDPDRRTALAYSLFPNGSILVQPALYGDTNLDGTVDDTDLATLQQSLSTDPTPTPSWSAGDFNYDNQINADDLALLTQNLGHSLPT